MDRSVYKYDTQINILAEHAGNSFEIKSINTDREISMDIEGFMFPMYNSVHGDVLLRINILKSFIVESMYNLKYIAPFFILYAMTNKGKNQLLSSTLRIIDRTIKEYILKEHHKKPFTSELELFIFSFLYKLNIPEDKAEIIAETISHVFEYDSAYLNRAKDIFTETTTEKLHKPKELRRLARLLFERNNQYAWVKKMTLPLYFISYMLYLPKFRKAYRYALSQIDIKNLQFTDNDYYWIVIASGEYNYQGLTQEEWKQYAKNKKWTYPATWNI